MNTTLIISSRFRKEHLRECLSSLCRQTVFPTETIIMEDSGDELYAESVGEMTEGFSCLSIRFFMNVPALGTVKSLNKACSLANGEIIVFTDDDCLFDSEWLQKLLSSFSEIVDAVGGRVVPIENDKVYTKMVREIGRVMPDGKIVSNFHGNPHSILDVDFLTAGNLAFRKSAWEKLNFDERYGGNAYRYETDFCLGLKGIVRYNPDAIVYHRRAREGGARVSGLEWHYWYARNHVIFLSKYFSKKWLYRFFFSMIFDLARGKGMSSRFKTFMKGNNFSILKYLLRGYFDGLKVMKE